MKKVGKVCYGKYENSIVYKEDKNNFFIKINNNMINIVDLQLDPDTEIDSTYYSMSDKEAKNTGLSIGLGGFLGLMAFNGIKGSSSYTIDWADGSYSNFEFDYADDETASSEFFSIINIMRYYGRIWKKVLMNYHLFEEEETSLYTWLEKNRKVIIYEILSYKDNLDFWTKKSKYFELFSFKVNLYALLNVDINNHIYSGDNAMIIIEKIGNADTMESLDNIFTDFIPTIKAKTLVNNGSITSNNIIEWAESFNGGVENFSQFLDNILKLMKENKSLEEITIYMFKEQGKFINKSLKITLKNSVAI